MGVWRKWVFPIIRIVVFAAIGIALVKLAFFSGASDTATAPIPTGHLTQPQVAVATGTITNNVTISGTVAADAAVPVKATLAGDVFTVSAVQGQHVDVGTPLMVIRQETPNPDGSTSYKTATVKSPAAGILSSLPVLVDQSVNVGDAVGQVAPPTFDVSGTLDPAEQYRLLNQPTEATVTITGGPAPFTCTGLTITTAPAGGDPATGTSGGASSSADSGTTVRCAVPPDVTVFAGLAAKMTVFGGSTKNALIVPVTAVDGGAGTGDVYLVAGGAAPKKTAVTLGLSDGKNVEITGGLKAGDRVLRFVPGAPAQATGDGDCVSTGGATVCGG